MYFHRFEKLYFSEIPIIIISTIYITKTIKNGDRYISYYYVIYVRIDVATIQIPIVVVEYLIASYYNIISGKVYYYYKILTTLGVSGDYNLET